MRGALHGQDARAARRAGFRVAVIGADRRLDLDKARRLLGASRHLRLGDEDEIRDGSRTSTSALLPPVGLPLPALIDVQLLFRRGWCAPAATTAIRSGSTRELVRLAEPRVGDV